MADNEILAAIAGVKKLLDVIGTQTGQTELDVRELKTDVGQLKTDVSQLKTDVSQLKTDVLSLRLDTQSLRMEMRAGFNRHEERIAALESQP